MQKRHSYNSEDDTLEILHLGKHNRNFLEKLPVSDEPYKLYAISLKDRMLWTMILIKSPGQNSINIQGVRGQDIAIKTNDQYDFFQETLLEMLDVNNLRLFHVYDKISLSNWGMPKDER